MKIAVLVDATCACKLAKGGSFKDACYTEE
jgi:hypothetical protein